MKKNITGLMLLGALSLASCSHDRSPGSSQYDPEHPGYNYEFEGDMYFPVPYEALSTWSNHYIQANPDSMNMRMPVKGTVARGKLGFDYPYPNTVDGYNAAGRELQNPLPATAKNIEEGKMLYSKYCWHCHGVEGEGDGPVIASGKFPPPSWKTYKSDYIRALPVGQMYHTITFGKNLMGAHGSQVQPEERWKIIHYIKSLAMAGGAEKAASDTTAAPAPEAAPGDQKQESPEQKGMEAPEKGLKQPSQKSTEPTKKSLKK